MISDKSDRICVAANVDSVGNVEPVSRFCTDKLKALCDKNKQERTSQDSKLRQG